MTWEPDLLRDLPSEDAVALEAAVRRQQAALDELADRRGEEADRDRATALWRLGNALFRLRRMTEATHRLEEAERELARVPGFDLLAAAARLMRAAALMVLKRYQQGAELAKDVMAFGEAQQNASLIRASSFAAAQGFKGAGRWQDAAAAAKVFLDNVGPEPTAKELPQVASALVIRAAAERLYGRPEEALALLETALPLAADDNDREQLHQAMDERAASLYSAGRPSEAIAAYDEIIAEFRDASDDFKLVAIWGSRAWKLRIRMRPHSPPRPPAPLPS